jgi:tetratricopeptide (TPR) repeat protein
MNFIRIRKNGILVIFLFLVFLFSQPFAYSQAGRGKGRASGTVVDEEGNLLPDIMVVIKYLGPIPTRIGAAMEDDKSNITRKMVTSKKGKWVLGGLGSGRWRVNINAEGYMPYQATIYISQFERNPYPESYPRLPLQTTLEKVEELLELDAPGVELFEEGNKLFKDEKYSEAIDSYRAFLEKNPDLYQVHYSIGNSYKELEKMEEALKEYQVVLDNAKDEEEKDKSLKAKTLSAVAECHLKSDDLDSAQTYFKESLELNPNDEILAYNVGEIYFSHQKLDEAIEYFKLASEIKPDWSDSYLKLGYVYVNKADNANAILYFEKFLALEPDSERAASVLNVLNYLKKQ